MNRIERPQLTGAGMFLVPAFVFGATLMFPLPASWQHYFFNYSPVYLVIIIGITFLLFRSEHRAATLAGGVFIAMLFALSLTARWQAGYSDAAVLAGFIPYKDSYYYYNGARLLLNGDLLNNSTAAYRPIFPGLLASLLPWTGHNMKSVLAALTGLLSLTCYWSARQMRNALGAVAASVYVGLFYFYFQAQIGYLHSELPGLTLGALGFMLIWRAVDKKQIGLLLGGLAVLVVGISIRAGAFFILPMLILWAGWAFRANGQRYSFRVALVAGALSVGVLMLCNTLYPRLVTAPETTTFGNFAYTLYGQVRGGAGWSEPLKELGTSEPAAVYRAALDFFLAHPLSFFIAVYKSYRDFFMPGWMSIFSFSSLYGDSGWGVWGLCIVLMFAGLYRLIRNIANPHSALLLAAFVGLLMSIPFLPPLDGGRRFYASTMPFFFATLAVALKRSNATGDEVEAGALHSFALATSSVLLILTMILPPFIVRFSSGPVFNNPVCPAGQIPFAVQIYPGSYVDIVDGEDCGKNDTLCYAAFFNNGVERDYDDFFQLIAEQSRQWPQGMRFFSANDFVAGRFHFFVGTPAQLPQNTLVTGCAMELKARFSHAYKVETSFARPIK